MEFDSTEETPLHHLPNETGINFLFDFFRSLCTEAAMGPVREIAMKAGENNRKPYHVVWGID